MAEVIAQLEKQVESQKKELEYARLKIQVLEERLRQQRIARFGPGSEKLSNLQLELLETEPTLSRDEVQAESEREPVAPPPATSGNKRREPHPGRQTLPAHLPRVEKVVACTPAQCICTGCGGETKVIGYETSEVLDVKPAECFVEVTKREKRACKKCEEQGVVAAPLAARIIEKEPGIGPRHHRHDRQKICRPLPGISTEFDSDEGHRHRDQPCDHVQLDYAGR